ncbi:TetR/AcrR family transcriptional regulator [Actinoplanes subtropicus]|uniref:TetR/AcrR family transcriptional regulator n=1 Tax=Actinoplanes subtropicus TaxID=543632 RepID=UPI00068FED03|nr:helix-turn-helix domain-containing protein [Actinoplanes subtropicus]
MPRRRTGSCAVGRQKRAQILISAAERFAAGGYHRTPMAQIAADVGLTEGGLLYHFPSKKHLLLAVAQHRLDVASAWW